MFCLVGIMLVSRGSKYVLCFPKERAAFLTNLITKNLGCVVKIWLSSWKYLLQSSLHIICLLINPAISYCFYSFLFLISIIFFQSYLRCFYLCYLQNQSFYCYLLYACFIDVVCNFLYFIFIFFTFLLFVLIAISTILFWYCLYSFHSICS